MAVVAGEASGAPPAYTLEDCLRLGRERAVITANARRDLTSAQAGISQARAEALPHVDLKAGYTRIDEVGAIELEGASFSLGREENSHAGAELTQLLYNGGQVRAALRAAKAYRRYAELAVRQAETTLDRDICIGFYDILRARAAVTVEQETVEQWRRFVEQAESRFRQQTVSEFDVLSARVRLANATPGLIAARNRLTLARETFRKTVHLEAGEFELQGELHQSPDTPTFERLLEVAVTNRPELRMLEQTARLRQEDLHAAKARYQPTLRAFGNYTGASSSQYNPTQSEWEWHWTAGLTAEWSVFDGGNRYGQVMEKRMALENARATRDDYRQQVALEIRQACADLTDAREAVGVAQGNVGLAERALSIARTRYDQGVATILEFTDSNLALSVARLTLVEALHRELTARARARHAAGLSYGE
jgi:outer membrane protein TolC